MGFKKIEKFGKEIVFEKAGDEFIGVLIDITKGKTQYGEADFLQFTRENEQTGEPETWSTPMSSALQGYKWQEYFMCPVKLVFTGEEKSKNHKGKKYKNFDVYVDLDGK